MEFNKEYIKAFDTEAQYNTFKASNKYNEPNVSYVVETNEVHYNPYVPRVIATFNVTDTSSPTTILSDSTGFSEIEIDGVVQPSATTGYTFSTTGEHTVKYTLTDPTIIGAGAFYGCSGLTSVTIPNSVTSIGGAAFRDCSGLASVSIPNSMMSIGERVFQNCSGLTSLIIGNSVTSIGQRAFFNCSSLTSVTIPNSVTSIGNGAFYQCFGLTSISVEKGNSNYDSRDNCNAIIETATNTLITGCMNTIIPNGVTSIGGSAFIQCKGLTSVTIPNSVTSIGSYAFGFCSGLISITCNATTAPTIQSATFQNIKTNGTLYVPIGSSGYDVWMGTGNYYLGKYGWTKVEQ